ncbi:MAG: hypothetical protein IRZ28_22655 [Steroidobacteraceae bacterium]|nr:hypothetical protein [Steroidobacteraceae bacterium]
MDASRLAACLTLAAILLVRIAALRAADVPSAEAFGAVPAVSQVELRPNGKLLAWREVTEDGSPVVVVFDVDAHAAKRRFTPPSEGKFRSLAWSDDETLLITLSCLLDVRQRHRREPLRDVPHVRG